MERQYGTVAMWRVGNGSTSSSFGFIRPDGGGDDVFVHISAVERSGLEELRVGQKVRFEIGRDRLRAKPLAISVQLVDPTG
jgi:CspA family cold shock protein